MSTVKSATKLFKPYKYSLRFRFVRKEIARTNQRGMEIIMWRPVDDETHIVVENLISLFS